jgi:hypothetical protein
MDDEIKLTDNEIEEIWNKLENVTFIENDKKELILSSDYYIWKAGTIEDDIWCWFDQNHSKGIKWLINEYENGYNLD